MNEIYQTVADCRETFVEMSYTFSQDENEIQETVSELMLYFLQMNPDTLRSIYEKDNKKGKSTLLNLMGEKKAYLYAIKLKKKILRNLEKHGKKAKELISTIEFILERQF